MSEYRKFCIFFAGAVGSSKTPISNFLSAKLGLPVFNNDAIRTEVLEDLGKFDEQEFKNRRNERVEEIMKSGRAFIYDASVDREWANLQEHLVANGFSWFIISLDLSKKFLSELYILKNYSESMRRIDDLLSDHQKFLAQYGDLVGLHISDLNFKDRLALSLKAVRQFIESRVN